MYKQSFITILLTLFVSMIGAKAFAHDIEVANTDGVTIYYVWINNNTELAVSYDGAGDNIYFGNVVIPESVEYEGNTYNVTSISNFAFFGCTGLTSITIPNSVTSIGWRAFFNCDGLTSVHISDIEAWCKIASAGNPLIYAHHLFLNGEEIKDLVIPDGVTAIGSYTFCGCSALTSVTIPDGVTSIGNYAFSDCTGLTSITIPNSVTSIGEWAFSNCDGLTSVHISDLEAWCKISFNDGYSNPLNFAHHLFLNGEEIKDLVIPNSVTSIGRSAFCGCSGLTSVTIPDGVTSIGESAFYNCSGLTSITISNSVTSIGSYAFDNCSGLTSVTIPDGVTNIGYEAFSGCNALKTVKSFITEPPSVNNLFSTEIYRNATLYIPAGTETLYSRFDGWKDFLKIVEMEGEEGPIYLTIIEGESEGLKIVVKQGENYRLNLNHNDGSKVLKVYFNDKDVTSQIDADNNYTTPNISKSSTIRVAYDNNYPAGDLNHDKLVDARDVVKLVDIIMNRE